MTDAVTLWREAFHGEVLGEALLRTMADRAEGAASATWWPPS